MNRRGFTLQNVELSLFGAVDPYFTGEAHLVYFIDKEGESRFEIEEAFATTTRLPFGLERQGLELELGQFFTEFGRLNPRHPHQWEWQDQPIVMTRFFGEDGIRGRASPTRTGDGDEPAAGLFDESLPARLHPAVRFGPCDGNGKVFVAWFQD